MIWSTVKTYITEWNLHYDMQLTTEQIFKAPSLFPIPSCNNKREEKNDNKRESTQYWFRDITQNISNRFWIAITVCIAPHMLLDNFLGVYSK
jgi:hypothetical protein